MNLASTILRDVSAAGGKITLRDGRLKLSAPKPLPQALVNRIREAKPILLATLQPCLWDATDWQEYFNERAGIAEYDGGMSRADAERMAYEACISRWMSLNPPGGHLCAPDKRWQEAAETLAGMGIKPSGFA